MIVFANGCFDLFHIGHLDVLLFAKEISCGGKLFVGVNSDASVRRLKGDGRPIMSSVHRASILRNLRIVDGVYVFADDTPLALIKHLKPDVIVKGPDYIEVPIDKIVGYGLAEIIIAPRRIDVSTSSIIEAIRR